MTDVHRPERATRKGKWPDLGIGTAPASLGAADANARPHAASIKVDASVTGMVKAFIRIG